MLLPSLFVCHSPTFRKILERCHFLFLRCLSCLQVSPQSPRYLVIPQPSMSVLRIDSAKAGKDDAKYECVAENGVGDAVVASATLSIYPGRPTYLYRLS